MQVATFEIRGHVTINNVSTTLAYLCDTQAIHYARGSELETTTHTILAQPKKRKQYGKRERNCKA